MITRYFLVIFCILLFVTNIGQAKPNISTNWSAEKALSSKSIDAIALAHADSQYAVVITQLLHEAKRTKHWVSQLFFCNKLHNLYGLTPKQTSVSAPEFTPKDDYLVYLAKGKCYQSIWAINLHTKLVHKVIEIDGDILDFKCAPNGKAIAFVATEKLASSSYLIDLGDARPSARIYLLNINRKLHALNRVFAITPKSRSILFNRDFSWSPDSKAIVYAFQNNAQSTYPLASKMAIVKLDEQKDSIVPFSATHSVYQPIYSPDGKWIGFGSSLDKTNSNELRNDVNISSQICIVDTITLKTQCLAQTFNQNPLPVGWNPQSSAIIAVDQIRAFGPQFYAISMSSHLPAKLLSRMNGYIDPEMIKINNNKNQMVFGFESVTQSAEIYASSCSVFRPKQISHIQLTVKNYLGKVKLINWIAKDGLALEGLLNFPQNYNPQKTYPLLVAIHGGPAESWSLRYLGGIIHRGTKHVPFCVADYLARGFVVFQPNPRGSNGYGLKYKELLWQNFGKYDWQDVISGVAYLVQHKIADPQKIAIFGWSFGGYMVPRIISQTTQFKAAVMGAGYVDLISYAGTSDIPMLLPEYFGFPFWLNAQEYLGVSPIMQVKNIATPLLIIHGDKDQRIPMSQGLELYNALKEQHKKVKMLVMPGEAHLPTNPNIILESMQQSEEWLSASVNMEHYNQNLHDAT